MPNPPTTPSSTLIDISVPITNTLTTWPGDPSVCCSRVLSLDKGDPANVSELKAGAHTGTHVDAFNHFLPDGASLDAMPLDPWVGPCRVIPIQHPTLITVDELAPYAIEANERIIFKTKNSEQKWYTKPFNPHFVHLNIEAAEYLAEKKIALVGIDYLSIEGYHADKAPAHHALMHAGVYILEGLYLGHVDPKQAPYELIALPIALHGADGAPARAVLRSLS